jgi:hypothetical protein
LRWIAVIATGTTALCVKGGDQTGGIFRTVTAACRACFATFDIQYFAVSDFAARCSSRRTLIVNRFAQAACTAVVGVVAVHVDALFVAAFFFAWVGAVRVCLAESALSVAAG